MYKNICIIAPSMSIKNIKKNIVVKAKSIFEKDFGFNVIFGKNILKLDDSNGYNYNDILLRAKDINDAFLDKNIDIILCLMGGFYTNQLLPYLDFDLIKNKPKPFCGFSDITVLLNAIYAKTGIKTYHTPNFRNFGYLNLNIKEYVLKYFRDIVIDKKQNVFLKNSDCWIDIGNKQTECTKNDGFIVINEGVANGTILGGNISTFNLLQGTEYMPSLKNTILFLEDDDDVWKEHSLGEFDRNLESICQLKEFNGIKGLVIGRFQKKRGLTKDQLEKVIKNKKVLQYIPIIANVDFGHTYPMMSFPIGGKCIINTSKKNIIKILN